MCWMSHDPPTTGEPGSATDAPPIPADPAATAQDVTTAALAQLKSKNFGR